MDRTSLNLNYETILTEVEAVLNSRPLSYMSATDLEQPLTPSHLMMGRRLLDLPERLSMESMTDEDYSATQEALTKRVQFLHRIMQHFWDRWRKEYLVELRSAHTRRVANYGNKEYVQEGDIVIIHDDNLKRNFWRLGLVEELIPGKDGMVRGAKVRVSVCGNRVTTWRRPVERLYPLEVNSVSEEPRETNEDTVTKSPLVMSTAERPKRSAAVQARERINVMKDLDLI